MDDRQIDSRKIVDVTDEDSGCRRRIFVRGKYAPPTSLSDRFSDLVGCTENRLLSRVLSTVEISDPLSVIIIVTIN